MSTNCNPSTSQELANHGASGSGQATATWGKRRSWGDSIYTRVGEGPNNSKIMELSVPATLIRQNEQYELAASGILTTEWPESYLKAAIRTDPDSKKFSATLRTRLTFLPLSGEYKAHGKRHKLLWYDEIIGQSMCGSTWTSIGISGSSAEYRGLIDGTTNTCSVQATLRLTDLPADRRSKEPLSATQATSPQRAAHHDMSTEPASCAQLEQDDEGKYVNIDLNEPDRKSEDSDSEWVRI